MIDSTEYKFDKLKMYFGYDYVVKGIDFGDIIIHQPTIGNILEMGENLFYQMLYIFIGNTTMRKLELWDAGIDWCTISDFELFRDISKILTPERTSIIFGDVDFTTFEPVIRTMSDGTEMKSSYSNKYNIEISESMYLELREYLRTMFNIFPKTEITKSKSTKLALIDEARFKAEHNESEDSNLLSLISFCLNHPGFNYKLDDLKEMGIYQFMDSVKRLQLYEETKALNNGRFSGMCDLSKVDKELFSYVREV